MPSEIGVVLTVTFFMAISTTIGPVEFMLIANILYQIDVVRHRRQHDRRKIFHLLRGTKRFNFDKCSDYECRTWFRFKKDDIRRLVELLNFPAIIRPWHRHNSPAIEGLLICLWRLSYPDKWDRAILVFGVGVSHLSEVNMWVLRHICNNWQHLLNLPAYYTEPATLRRFADAVRDKGCPLSNCVGFLDSTLNRIARPTRYQRACYSGYKKTHGLKWQNVVFADGIIGHAWGPAEGRRSDPWVMRASGIVDTLRNRMCFNIDSAATAVLHRPADPTASTAIRPGPPPFLQYCLYADKGYFMQIAGCIIVPFKRSAGHVLSVEEEEFNSIMARFRIAVEWCFLKIVQQFGFLDLHKQMKIFNSPVGPYYRAATLFTNFHTCLYGSQTSRYFNVQPPTLEDYLLM
jgi:hypothetical protein